MRFLSPRIHGFLDYAVAFLLIGAPLALDFAATTALGAAVSIAAGIGLVVYSLLTDYSAGLRALIPWRVHLILDAVAAVALLALPFVAGFGGAPRAFFVGVAVAVLAVVAVSQVDLGEEDSPAAATAG